MKPTLRLAATALAVLPTAAAEIPDRFEWDRLPDLPRALGGQFAGVANGALVVIGGSYFDIPPYEGGRKERVDTVFVLETGSAEWKTRRLGFPLAYGGSVTTPDGVVLVGGGDSQRHHQRVLRLRWEGDRLAMDDLPALPMPVANTAAAILDNTVYVAGGQESPSSTQALRRFWALDLGNPQAGWRDLEPWPGPGRIFASLAAQGGSIYLFGGAELVRGEATPVTRRFLQDTWRFRPEEGWRRIAGLPYPVAAAPCLAWGQSHVLLFGGDDGANFSRQTELKDRHPGFRREVLAYHTITDTWAIVSRAPEGLVTTTAVDWNGRAVIAGGEDRPGHRSSAVYSGTPREGRHRFGGLDYAVLGAYLAGIVLMGVFFTRLNRDAAEFFLGGKRLPWWAVGLSIYGTQLSSLTFMAIPAKAYATDWTYTLVNLCILLVAPVVVVFYLPFFRRLNVTTAYEYLERRFNRPVRLLASAIFLLFQLGRMAVVMFLPAIALATVGSLDVYTCIVVMGGLAVAYTVFGGIQAVIWTDAVQAVVLLGGAVLSLALAIQGFDGGVAAAANTAFAAGKFKVFDWKWDWTSATAPVILIGNFASVLSSYTTDQTVVQRYLTTVDERRSARSIWTNAALTVPSTLIFFGLGTALWIYYQSNPESLNPHLTTDAILPWFMVQRLPVGVAGLVLAGLFAAAQSTLSSSIHSMSTALMVDFYRPFRRGDVAEKRELRLARLFALFFGIAGTASALLLATLEIQSLWDTFLTLLSLLAGSLGGVFALGIFSRRANSAGALTGGVVSVALVALVHRHTDVHFFLYAAIGFAACVGFGYLVSLFAAESGRDLRGLTIHTQE